MVRRAVLAALFAAGLFVAVFAMPGSSSPPCWAKHGACPSTSTAQTTTATTATTTTTPSQQAQNPVPPPASGAYFGAYIEGAQTYGYYFPAGSPWSNAPIVDPNTSDPWTQFETDAGKKVAMLMFGESNFFNIAGDYDGNFAAARARGAIPVVDVQTQNLGTLADIAAGKYDAQLMTIGRGAATLGPFVLRIDAEMNGGWYPFGAEIRALGANGPATFVAAWRRIHDIFTNAGATNISYHWCPNVDPENIQTPLEQLYPGDAYVDWTGMTGYGHTSNESEAWVFDSTYTRLVQLAPSKPIMVGEVGAVDAGYPGYKAQFINDFFNALETRYPDVRAFCWFNWRIYENGQWWDWPIESSAAGQSAFDQAVASNYIVGRG